MSDAAVNAVRQFSRYYTRRIGVLEDSLLGSGLTLPQGRLLYEIAQCDEGSATPGEMAAQLGLDAGYVSRLIAALEARGLVVREPSASDARRVVLRLTDEGQAAFAAVDRRSRSEVAALLARIEPAARSEVVAAMRSIERNLEPKDAAPPRAVLREPRCGDIGWVVHRHAALYHLEYGWDWTFEALVAKVAGAFIDTFDPARDCCRIADASGEVVGSAFVVRTEDARVAKLRLVYVEPGMRGTGLGRRLVEDCMTFARCAGYGRMTLWTNDPLIAARRLYEKLGFEMTASEPVTAFGHEMASETWGRDL
ncbi:MAG: GNAT family N-acetyltransferase [Hyphomicrobiaceae bacterium]